MPPDVLLLLYAGLAAVAAADPRFRNPRRSQRAVWLARGAGGVMLALSAGRAVAGAGAGFGAVAWAGGLSVTATALVLLLSRWPRLALAAGVPLATAGVALASFLSDPFAKAAWKASPPWPTRPAAASSRCWRAVRCRRATSPGSSRSARRPSRSI